ncbi:hypothetical protein H5410_002237 [Solanum commersonii]|uniref:Uncharacterized protein n=1 Tax=Solanum commersonii TaxID=4109 RepID=A0A9J6B1F9_SOLCO|nr:hypothetical protein H5410_002237 [Solanum commersonii]
MMMAQTKLDQNWSLVYLFVKLNLILHIATAICKIKWKIFENGSNDAIIDRFQCMKSRRVQW